MKKNKPTKAKKRKDEDSHEHTPVSLKDFKNFVKLLANTPNPPKKTKK